MLRRGFAIRHRILLIVSFIVLAILSDGLKAEALPQPLMDWEYRWGDSPLNANGEPEWLDDESADWQSTASPSNPPGREGHQHLWLRTTLPEGDWNDPVLYITSINLIGQAYLGDELIYQYGEFDDQGRGDFAGWPWHMIDLPEGAAGQVLTFRLYSYYTSIGLWGEVQIMERIDVLKHVIHESAQDLGVSALVLVLGILATLFALIGPERRGFLAIALFAYASGLMLLAEAPARQLIADGPLAWDMLRAGSYYTLPIALGMLLSHWLEGTAKRWIKRLWALHLAYLVMAMGLVQLGFISLSITFPVFDVLLAVTMPFMLLLALFRFRRLNLEQRLLVLSFTFFAPLLLADMVVAHGFVAWRTVPLSYGSLAFSLAIATIFLWHYRRTQQQLATANETLEQQVTERTAELGQLVQELEGLSFEDPLTGLHNRRHFNTVFDHECRRAQQHGSQLSLLMLDLDHFKDINDHFGHDAGDAVLVKMAALLSQHFMELGVVCRIGGEEFVALLPEASADTAESSANALLDAVAQCACAHQGVPLRPITLSCGIATYPDHAPNPHKLLRLADEALYHAKRSGRNRCVVWSASFEEHGFILGRRQPH
ncbi:diguanylate cyclase (GGDEF) domain-containing protein [Vreelandella subterranea]|uniref:diguanylate cyclase n=1 Tax=Vreelandella subterranea TaxID=416874 RepID=A0A1H9SVX8_9GAMM|nr:diguanylate cyclase [Halomonas subterranea]SER89081.1 diguanylate cyclase (GGDEF) domain-containing protein [Halomonas subterranea]